MLVPEQEEAVKAYIDLVKKVAIPSGELWKPWSGGVACWTRIYYAMGQENWH